ncbi:hypothetical protein F4824DRAFT_451596 [Ustulina deusta]|nr:hypothetical protein F4823DRAFT_593151 [Ustulina deusta]KAI3340620.1 hypothetical protein F4824DRAFT_451596 [Ustulina deusta]
MAITFSRRSDGTQRSHHNQRHASQASQQQQQQQHGPPSPAARMKRPLNPIDNLSDPLRAKRTRIAVEIFARPLAQALGPSKPLVNRQRSTTQPAPVASSQKPDRPSPIATNPLPAVRPPTSIPTPVPQTTAPPPQSRSPPPPPPTTTTATTTTAAASKENGLTRHQEKVINGIRHELGRLQPSAADTSSATGPPGRKLRSQEATRFKSELAAYFPEYDEVIGNDPKEQHLLNADTPIIILDTDDKPSDAVVTATPSAYQPPTHSEPRPHFSTVRVYSDRLFTDLHNSPIVNLDFLKAEHNGNDLEDPLPDSHFAPTHRRAERLEKSIRNTERGRAQHEKDQIIRLLGELQGHDWLRTMGVNGVTESRRKTFEPARDHFIKGCQAILEKFRLWSQEEKRRKLERERALAEETDDEEDEDRQEDDVDDSNCSEGAGSMDDVDMVDVENESGDDLASEGDPPEHSDVDAAARQLHDEAMERARYATATSPRRTRGEHPPTILDLAPPEFTSFFRKRHQRDAALNKGRRRGRTVLAWGHPVPEMSEYDFELPDFCLDEDTLRAHERQKRRDRRNRRQRRQGATTSDV